MLVLRAMIELKNATLEQNKLKCWQRLCQTETWKSAQKTAKKKHVALTLLIKRHPNYRRSLNKLSRSLPYDIPESLVESE